MDEPFIGEIRPISFNYAPKNWALCNGQLLNVQQNQALFALLGTTFGGNGQTTFGLPDLRSRIPIGSGQLSGGGNYFQGQASGTEGVTLLQTQIPNHNHTLSGTLLSSDSPEASDPNKNLPAAGGRAQYTDGAANAQMASFQGTTATAGSSQAHENRQPYMSLNYVIALTGIFPSRA